TDQEVECLKTGQPLPWEGGNGAQTAAPAPAAAAAAPAPSAVAVASPPAGGAPSALADELMKSGRKWSRSSIAAENNYRKKKSMPLLSDADSAYLLGEEAPAPAAAAAPAASAGRAGAAPARAASPALPSTPPSRSEGPAVRYVGRPAVGTSQAAAAGGVATLGPVNTEVDRRRRRIVWVAVAAFLTTWLIAFFRFFLPRTLFEPSTVFKLGYPSDYGLGVDTKWQQKYRIWVTRTPDRLFVIYARCTHLGCTPDWKPSESKFKCPCHGSGYDTEGVNFEGPAPRPMDRAHVEVAPDGQIVVDVSRLYAWPKGQASQFDSPGAFV
ncbi:MAG: ubiquinol-cytochrome c reductase iron-sulfur subunit, partial [Candidatus Korobacteraceae bacterium]